MYHSGWGLYAACTWCMHQQYQDFSKSTCDDTYNNLIVKNLSTLLCCYLPYIYTNFIWLSNWTLLSAGKWSSPPTTGPRPPPCFFFSFTAINDHQAVLFGGNQPGHRVVDECYLMDFQTMVCWERHCNNSVSIIQRRCTIHQSLNNMAYR